MLKNLAEYNKYRHVAIPNIPNNPTPPITQFPTRHEENQYLNLIDDILSEGAKEEGRNGATFAVVGATMHFSLNDRRVPFLTTKRLAWKTCLKELLWFIRGHTDNALLQAQGGAHLGRECVAEWKQFGVGPDLRLSMAEFRRRVSCNRNVPEGG